jgi:predicted transcriptional regulator
MAHEAAIANAEAALAQVASRVREPRVKPVEPGADAEFNGELLRQVRESKGMSIHTLAERTRIAQRHIENVEADRYDALPAAVYLRGILMNVARELALDPIRVAKSYLALATGKGKT